MKKILFTILVVSASINACIISLDTFKPIKDSCVQK